MVGAYRALCSWEPRTHGQIQHYCLLSRYFIGIILVKINCRHGSKRQLVGIFSVVNTNRVDDRSIWQSENHISRGSFLPHWLDITIQGKFPLATVLFLRSYHGDRRKQYTSRSTTSYLAKMVRETSRFGKRDHQFCIRDWYCSLYSVTDTDIEYLYLETGLIRLGICCGYPDHVSVFIHNSRHPGIDGATT